MTIAMIPHALFNLANLDVEKINDNLEAGARDVARNLSKRFTYSTMAFDLTGITDLSVDIFRRFNVRRSAASAGASICGVELVIYTATAVTWTVACSDALWPGLTLLTTAGVTTESYSAQMFDVDVASSTADLAFTLAASGTSTITNGWLVVHLRCDRGNQGANHDPYAPNLFNSFSSTAGASVDAELTALAAAVAGDTANDKDLRCECYKTLNLAAGSSVVFRVPGGARRVAQITVYMVAAAGANASATVSGTGIVGLSATANGTGALNLVVGTDTPTSSAIPDDPMDPTDDTIITLAATGVGTVLSLYALVWWT